jgi:hypothetical protein
MGMGKKNKDAKLNDNGSISDFKYNQKIEVGSERPTKISSLSTYSIL